MKKISRPIGVLLCAFATKLVILKHKPTIYVITGSGETSLVRESLYLSIKEITPTRRNLEKPEAEFSIPLTIFGEFHYPTSLLSWIKIYTLTLLRIIYLKPYKHTIILEINSINQKILNRWLPILNPENLLVVGDILKINLKFEAKLIKINNEQDIIKDISKQVVDFVSNKYHINVSEILKKQNSNVTPISRINFAKSKLGNIVINASYFQFAPQIKSVEEIIELFPGPKKLIGNVPQSWKDTKFVRSLQIIECFEQAGKEDILLLVGNRKDVINLRKDLFI